MKIEIFKNATYLFASNVVVRLFGAATSILIARYLGPSEYGVLGVALAFAGIVAYFSDIGLSSTLIREGTKDGADLPRLLGTYLKIRLLFAVGVTIIFLIVIQLFYKELYFRNILYWIVLPTVFGAVIQGIGVAYFQVTEQMKYSAFIIGVSGTVTTSTLLLGIVMDWSLASLAPLYGFSNFAGALLSLCMVSRRCSLFIGWDVSIFKGLGYFIIGGIITAILPQLGPLILERITDLQEVGYFAVAYRIPLVLYQVPGIIAIAFYPMLFRYGSSKDDEQHMNLSIIELKVMNTLGILMALPFLFYSNWWTLILFGEQWDSASRILMILSIMIILQSINYALADSLTTKGLQSKRSLVLCVALPTGILAYFFFGSIFGGLGGGFAALSIEITLLVGFVSFNPTGWNLIRKGILKNLFSFFLVCILGISLGEILHPILGILTLIICYSSFVFILDKEIRYLFINLIDKKLLG
jgi:O-antigen/teichoic acid export membrane protein